MFSVRASILRDRLKNLHRNIHNNRVLWTRFMSLCLILLILKKKTLTIQIKAQQRIVLLPFLVIEMEIIMMKMFHHNKMEALNKNSWINPKVIQSLQPQQHLNIILKEIRIWVTCWTQWVANSNEVNRILTATQKP